MHEQAILQIDQAALNLIQTLDTHGEELKPYLEDEHLELLQAEVMNLRQVLLGLEMGILYQDYQDWNISPDVLKRMVSEGKVPINEVASQVVDTLQKKKE
ncbi:MAG: hypothetical protein GFH27_549303n237 [Chloroflexi bacterium AL-W]|nr:hypothetical protein [Chloroflexi bacterium AL-N1]NOK68122.1 hypothetical protein [Chloroflexi bacterium AL-N10]NOK73462.1 hypothetical protein [Chloroflexi bacterium AL-N5]NOK83376.1 hypothetical protein [Chloroflexi bacterium AL-W]NOK87793.1 hypothetical protein [Chloroflexi bacterium AL-N15]